MKEGVFLKYIRLYQFCWNHRLKVVAKTLDFINKIVFSCDIPPSCHIGKGTTFPHYALGVVMHPRSELGENCKIYQHVTIGSRNGNGPPILGENVLVGSGATILGNVTIGDNVNIGSNSIVLNDVPSNCTVVGVPARVIVKKPV